MFRFIKIFTGLLSVCTIGGFGESLASNYKERIKCVSLNYRPCQTRPRIVDINSNETLFYPFTVSANMCARSCKFFDDPYAQVYASNKVKNMNVKIFI